MTVTHQVEMAVAVYEQQKLAGLVTAPQVFAKTEVMVLKKGLRHEMILML